MNDKYNKLEIAVIMLSILCWIAFVIMFILGYIKWDFENAPIYQKILSGFFNQIFVAPFFAVPLLIMTIILKRKKGRRKILLFGFITCIPTLLLPLLILIFLVIGLWAWHLGEM